VLEIVGTVPVKVNGKYSITVTSFNVKKSQTTRQHAGAFGVFEGRWRTTRSRFRPTQRDVVIPALLVGLERLSLSLPGQFPLTSVA
jgi:hypothetical protein